MSGRPPNESIGSADKDFHTWASRVATAISSDYRGPAGSPHSAGASYKRSRTSSPSMSRSSYSYHQEPSTRYGIPPASGYAIYRDPYPPNHHQDYRDMREPEYMQVKRRPTLLPDFHAAEKERNSEMYDANQESAQIIHYQTIEPTHISKRPRLGDYRPDLAQPLKIDTSGEGEVKKEPAYNPQVEAISPTLPTDESSNRASKEYLLQAISRVDREIQKVEQDMMKLKKSRLQIEEVAAKPPEEKPASPELITTDTKHQSIAQLIYSDNRRKADEAHNALAKLGPKIDMPLYNQPSDTTMYHGNKLKYQMFKKRLIVHFKMRFKERKLRERYLTERYDQLMQAWLKKIERLENNAKRKARDSRMREFYEKVFPEIKKAREDKERFAR